MKKIFYTFMALNLLLVSCTNNEDTSPTQETVILPKTTAITYTDFPEDNSKSTITYDGNKIVSAISTTYKTKYTYDGNLIVKQEVYKLGLQGEETINRRIVYEYENGKLKIKTSTSNFDSDHPNGDYTRKQIYTYKTDGIISYSQLDVRADIEYKRGDVYLTYQGGNLIKQVDINTDLTVPTTTFLFEYDNKNNPLKNILGFDLLLNETSYSINNIVKKTVKGRTSPTSESVYNSTPLYNTNNYLTKSTSFTSDGKTPEYVMEYTY